MTTIANHDFNQDPSHAKRAARIGPVYITERGRPTHVLLTIEDFLRLNGGKSPSLLATLMQGGELANFEFEPYILGRISGPVDL